MSMKVTKEQFVGVTYDELIAENAKLRELLADLAICACGARVTSGGEA